ncbi:MAG TPA: hypothetical protein VMT20_28415 [Terriglobia bacterium]|nr:hypothetical protein [Terriglobia bacterium]
MTQRLETRDERRETGERGKRQEAKGNGQVGNAIASWLLPIACLCVLLAATPRTGVAFQKPTAAAAAANAPTIEPDEQQVDQDRGALDRFLDSHPEIQRDVISDPNRIISDPNFMHDHPALQAFLDAHPLVKADPRAFVSPELWRFENRRSDTEELLSWFIPFTVFVFCLLAVLWVLRLVLENRRWNKSFKIHEEVHTKLIEKFASGQDLTAYMGSDAGRRLLEWTPPSLDAGPRGVPAAAGRILWSIQAGLVLGLVGVGLLLIRDRVTDAVQPLLVFGTLGATVGAGFIISAFVSYALSKHLGLMGEGIQSEPRPRIDSLTH